MNIPNFIDNQIVDKNGQLTDSWRQIFTQLIGELQGNLSNEGYKIPEQSTANITILSNTNSTRALIYDNQKNAFMACANGIFKQIPLEAQSNSLGANIVVVTDSDGDLISSSVSSSALVAMSSNMVTLWTAPLHFSSGTASITQATTTTDGYLSHVDWNTFNNKQSTLTFGNLTTSTTGVSITGGTNAVVGSGTTVNVQNASISQNGLLTSADWSTFNTAASTVGAATVAETPNTLVLRDANGNSNLGVLDGSNKLCVDNVNRQLSDSSPWLSLDWNVRMLYDNTSSGFPVATPTKSLDWLNRQAFSQDSHNNTHVSIDYANHTLSAFYTVPFPHPSITEFTSVDWGNCLLSDQFNVLSADWQNRNLFDMAGLLSNDWQDRVLYDNGVLNPGIAASSVDYGNRFLIDEGGTNSLDWEGRTLICGGNYVVSTWDNDGLRVWLGHNEMMFFSNQTGVAIMSGIQFYPSSLGILDSNSVMAVDANNRIAKDSSATNRIDWQNGWIWDEAGNIVMGFSAANHLLYDNLGDIVIDLNNYLLQDNGGNSVFNWNLRQLNDDTGVTAIQFGGGNYQISNPTQGNVVFDWNNGFLADTTSGNYVLDLNNRLLEDNQGTNSAGVTSIDFQNRICYDKNGSAGSAGKKSLDYQNRNLCNTSGTTVINYSSIPTIETAMVLAPQTSAPSSPTDGTIYVGGSVGSRHVYIYLNSAWHTLI
jgi:hypothetical protein